MNAWQVARQLKSLLAAAVWPDSPGGSVFGTVAVSAGPSAAEVGRMRWPVCLVAVGSSTADREEPGLVLQQYEIRLAQRVAGDPFAEGATLGGPRSGGQGQSQGRGVLELEEVLMTVAGQLGEQNGVQLRCDYRSAVAVTEAPEVGGSVALRSLTLEAWTGVDRSYPPPLALSASVAAPNVALSWTLPPSRYDTLGLVLRRATGSTPPATATSGTGVTVGALVSSVSDAPGSGTFSYALFMGYDETTSPPATADRHSAAATVAGVVVP